MSAARLFHHPLILRTIFGVTFMIICFGLMSCGRSDMKERGNQHSAKEAVKESSKILMIQSDDLSYKKCFKFPPELYATNTYPNEVMFWLKHVEYISGAEKSPGIIGEPGMSRITIGFFRDKSAKEYYIHSLSRAYKNGQLKIEGEYKEFYLYDVPQYSYSAINKHGLLNIEYLIGDGRPRSKEKWIHELKLIVDFVESHTIPCQGAS
ncbi:hypothetical protein FUT69_09270 [Xylella taiwanensis]|uniref:Lipoprotein n=1 Tax=Xylella taiwanensis TaxID=1444770 RepID=Z9JN41_9GAMM|nr:hypothetical protein [Xylella taiwanensis]AXI83244.1 hypothetical protein AB672_04485 [Xylella taiwanensis]EWS79221.1 hypothetical protein AF72_01960 [Xylella taiwanensis]NBI37327.1 hypothetical protein [Xylella taiwanensis]QKD98214.1 hypothetical protein PLS229_04525 [Xylella taiwanensis]UFM93464.1 hypothetical protein LPH39_10245 [Xylella taiwanensis]